MFHQLQLQQLRITQILHKATNVDILRGRGGGTNHHPGNKKFRDEARFFRARYKDKATTRREKYELSLTLVKRARDYGGRFLERRNGDDKNWYLMSEGDVRKKASQGKKSVVYVFVDGCVYEIVFC